MVGSVDTGVRLRELGRTRTWRSALVSFTPGHAPRTFFLRTWQTVATATYSPSPDRPAGAGNPRRVGGLQGLGGNHGGGRPRPDEPNARDAGWVCRGLLGLGASFATGRKPRVHVPRWLVAAVIAGDTVAVVVALTASQLIFPTTTSHGGPVRAVRGGVGVAGSCSPHSAATPRRAWPLVTLSDSSAGP